MLKYHTAHRRYRSRDSVIDAIVREGDEQAIACLIALLRDAKATNAIFDYDYIETGLYNLIFGLVNREPVLRLTAEFIAYLNEHIVENDNSKRFRSTPWQLTDTEIISLNAQHTQLLLIAEDLNLIGSKESAREFFYLVNIGNREVIIRELIEALNVGAWTLKDTNKGLKWLVKKLNAKRPKSRKIGNVI